ncbi:MAG: riboflavin synthase, partial [candidate division WOR-3 bacterium]
MFTGLVEAVGTVRRTFERQGNRILEIGVEPSFVAETKPGDSISVNGCCLTITERKRELFRVEAVRSTLEQTTLGQFRAGRRVNLERALRGDSRLGGHFVQGHVDETGRVERLERGSGERVITIAVRRGEGLLLPKGSVCVDGVSLTVAEVGAGRFCVKIIPYTAEHTTLGQLQPG